MRRTRPLDPVAIADEWFSKVLHLRDNSSTWLAAQDAEAGYNTVAQFVRASRRLCRQVAESGPIWGSYGGHYFSPAQAATIDAMVAALPEKEPMRTVCLAATIASGSQCAASPRPYGSTLSANARGSSVHSRSLEQEPVDGGT